MSARRRRTNVAPFYHTAHGLDEALKAGLGAAAGSLLILGIVLLVTQGAPAGIG
jgi:hypothetical protein